MNVFIKIVVVTLSGVVLTVILLTTSDIPNKNNNGFDRYFLPIEPKVLNTVNLNFPSREIVHLDEQEVFISTDSSNIILSYRYHSDQIEHKKLELDSYLRSQIGNVYSFDYNATNTSFTLFANNLRGILIIKKDSFNFFKLGNVAYSHAVTISPTVYVLRRFEEKTADAVFERIFIPSGIRLRKPNLPLKSTDGGLSTDGQLLYNEKTGLLNYMHYYNNEILSFDTTLTLIQRFRTIDTVSYKEQLDREKPLLVSNKKSFVYGDYIFICSNLRADNESKKDYIKNIPIDIYNVNTGIYKGSIYIPVSNRKLIRSLRYDGQILSALYYDNRLILFHIPLENFGF